MRSALLFVVAALAGCSEPTEKPMIAPTNEPKVIDLSTLSKEEYIKYMKGLPKEDYDRLMRAQQDGLRHPLWR